MTLAQVVYQMSNDTDFASQLFSNPESTLKLHGLKLSQEELAFLVTAHQRDDQPQIVNLSEDLARGWR
jgi:hypothetical protein